MIYDFRTIKLLELSPEEIKSYAQCGMLPPGVAVCVLNGERGFLNHVISFAQKRAMLDLLDNPDKDLIEEAKLYSHTAMVYNAYGVHENYYPHCRFRAWDKFVGNELVFVKPDNAYNFDLKLAAHLSSVDVALKTPYPSKELLYYGKWITKRFRSFIPFVKDVSFFDLFDDGDDEVGVCSAMVMNWWNDAGIIDEPELAWYPSRFLVDEKMTAYMRVKVVEK